MKFCYFDTDPSSARCHTNVGTFGRFDGTAGTPPSAPRICSTRRISSYFWCWRVIDFQLPNVY